MHPDGRICRQGAGRTTRNILRSANPAAPLSLPLPNVLQSVPVRRHL